MWFLVVIFLLPNGEQFVPREYYPILQSSHESCLLVKDKTHLQLTSEVPKRISFTVSCEHVETVEELLIRMGPMKARSA